MDLFVIMFIFVVKSLIKIGDFVLFLLKEIANFSNRQLDRITTLPLEKKHRRSLKRRSGKWLNKKITKLHFAIHKKKVKAKIKINLFFLKIKRTFKRDLSKATKIEKKAVKEVVTPIHKAHKVEKKYKKLALRFYDRIRRSRLRRLKKFRNLRLPFFIKFRYFVIGTFFSFLFFFLPLLFFVFVLNLPNPNDLTLREVAQSTKILDRNGTLLYQIYANQNRTMISLNDVPKSLKEATIAIEDKDFYSNPGFDIMAIIRAAIADLKGEPLQGGSTITQQLMKTTLLTPEVTITRKVKEIILAFWAERIYTKDKILEMYFNQVPYGGTAWGVEAAAETYFGKHTKDLNLAESAFLAGLTQAPTTYSPYGQSPTLWKRRQKEVLTKMKDLKYITEKQRSQAEKEELNFQPPQVPIHAPHFVMYVRDLLIKEYGLPMVEKGGLIVTTSLDMKTQKMSENVVKNEVEKNAKLHLTNGAALVTNPKNGDILAMVGSKDYNDPNSGNVNLTTSLRQPGSSIKVLTYSAALSKGFTAATILDDSPVTFGSPGGTPYSPVNYDGRFHGRVSLRSALGNSFNIPAVKTLNMIGVPTMIELGKKMGITTWNDTSNFGLSLTLGAGETKMVDMATLYGTLANEGKKVNVNPFLSIKDYKGNIIQQKDNENIPSEQVLDPGVAFIISDILADNNARLQAFGTNSGLVIKGRRVSVKTGTSDNKRDNWTFGYTPTRLVSVWVGNNDNSPMDQKLASGITGAAPIWNQIMTNLLKNGVRESIAIPSDIVPKNCGGRTEYFIRGTQDSASCIPSSTSSASLTRQ